ncbi:MAG: PKD domain-containing protein [candidate division Zixibacteria bacterium]
MSRNFILALLALSFLIGQNLKAANLLQKPEAIIFDEPRSRYLISNWDSGDIVQLDKYGSYTIFYSGLSSSTGLHIVGDTLFAGSNASALLQGIALINLETAELIDIWQPPGMLFANDIATDTSGNLFVTDTWAHRIYKYQLSDLSVTLLTAGIQYPNGMHFDIRNNRLLIASNVPSTPVYAVDPITGAVTSATTYNSTYDGFGEDRLHNLYVSDSDAGKVFRFDSTLSGVPETVANGHNVPEGIDFNILHGRLCIPNMFAHTIDLIPIDVDLWGDISTSFGDVPLNVTFDGGSIYTVTGWLWDFGDGDSAFVSNISHVYTDPGLYDVTLQIVTATDDTLKRVYPIQIAALADTLQAVSVEIDSSNAEVMIDIRMHNNMPVREIVIPIEFSGDLDLSLDSISTEGCRSESFEIASIIHAHLSQGKMTVMLSPRSDGAPLQLLPGSGSILKLYFRAVGDRGDEATISLSGYSAELMPKLTGDRTDYEPVLSSATVSFAPCCHGTVGNVNSDLSDMVDISDLTRLVNHLFVTFELLGCPAEANSNGDSGCTVDISDLTKLVNHLFVTLEALPACLPECG